MIYESLKYALLSALLTVSTVVSSDDTEIFFSRPAPYAADTADGKIAAPNPNYPNILFILDYSWSMKEFDGTPFSRFERLKQAMTAILSSAKGVNIGVMRYSNNNSGGRILYPMSPIEYAKDDVQAMLDATDNRWLDWFTPTVGAMLEAAYYWRGDPVHFGNTRYSYPSHLHRTGHLAFGSVSHPDSYTGGEVVRDPLCTDENPNHTSCDEERIDGDATYISPIVSECQANYQILISDGAANPENDLSAMKDLVGGSCAPTGLSAGRFTCAAELADHLATADLTPGEAAHKPVKTYTVGFNTSLPTLEAIATAGQGEYFESSSADELASVISSVLEAAVDGNQFFAAPAITLDQFSRLSHRDEMYLALFKPSNTTRWAGNLKKYRFDGTVKDQTNEGVIDLVAGGIKETTHSYWSDPADGNVVENGGAAHRLDDITTRNVYTFTGTGNVDLTNTVNSLSELNPLVTSAMLGVPDDERTNLLQWARGVDVKDEFEGDIRLQMGDPLHSRPVILNYGGDADNPEAVVFIGTNEGYLHAIDASSGNELYSFVPPELLGNLDQYYENNQTINRLYGLDGDLTLWVNDVGMDGEISGTDDHAYLYMGMRRGGRNYTALNVTNKAVPKLMWSINGGDTGFEKLGQSWSKPTLSTIAIKGVATKVLIFGGGYDSWQDNATFRSPDTIGNDMFIVNAETGALLWSTANDPDSFTAMQYSIPSDPRVVDMNGDGLADQIYVGDMGGQVWRFDIDNNATTAAPGVTGGVIANLSGDGVSDYRRFFYRPDVAMVSDGHKHFLSIAIGSGNRAHPLQTTVDDRFYMIRQLSVFNAPDGYGILKEDSETEYRALTEDDLYNATQNLVGSTDVEIATTARGNLDAKQGWLLELRTTGEKVLAPSLTLSSQIIFSTYLPETGASYNCEPAVGGGRTYTVSALDATPTNGATADERSDELVSPGIPPEPVPHLDEDGTVKVIVGVEEIDTPTVQLTRRVYWTEQPDY